MEKRKVPAVHPGQSVSSCIMNVRNFPGKLFDRLDHLIKLGFYPVKQDQCDSDRKTDFPDHGVPFTHVHSSGYLMDKK